MFSNPELFWFIIGLVLLVSELMLPGFVIVFFGIGAWFAALTSALGLTPGINSQLIVFLVSSILSLVFFRKKGKQFFEGKVSGILPHGASMDEVRGDKATAVTDIVPGRTDGKVEYHGTNWTAEGEQHIQKGQMVEIIERNNLVLKVKPLQ
jgi:inner membrane protein